MILYYSSPVKIEIEGRMVYLNNEPASFEARLISQMQDVLAEPVKYKRDYAVYLMFRNLYSKNNIRYDITVLSYRPLGRELAKTYGHFHPLAKKNLSYPEVYQILKGSAFFVLQKLQSDESVDVMVVYGTKDDVILIPPNWGHVSVNASTSEPLILGNLVYDSFQSDYSFYKNNRGAAYYITLQGLEQNFNYIIRSTKKYIAKELNQQYSFYCEDLLKEFSETPEKFEFLKDPSLLL